MRPVRAVNVLLRSVPTGCRQACWVSTVVSSFFCHGPLWNLKKKFYPFLMIMILKNTFEFYLNNSRVRAATSHLQWLSLRTTEWSDDPKMAFAGWEYLCVSLCLHPVIYWWVNPGVSCLCRDRLQLHFILTKAIKKNGWILQANKDTHCATVTMV